MELPQETMQFFKDAGNVSNSTNYIFNGVLVDGHCHRILFKHPGKEKFS